MEDTTKLLEIIIKRLNIVIALQLDALSDSDLTPTSKRIRRLNDLGLSPGDIGSILGKKANYVSAVIGSGRKTTDE